MAFHSMEEILDYCRIGNKKFYEAVLEDDMEERKVSREESMKEMYVMWDAMLLASTSYDGSARSASHLVGGQGLAMEEYRRGGNTLCGDYLNQVISQALEMGESNACMRRIVAAPTAGACGVLPAVLIPFFRSGQAGHRQIVKSLYVAAGIGQVIASRAFIAGAAGGCQAEIGSAIPADQVFVAMREVGEKMHPSLRETGEGGLAATKEGIRITRSLVR